MSLLWVTNTVLAHRRLVFGLPLLLALVVLGVTLSRPRTYTASTSFTPRSTDMPKSGLGNIAAQFGVAVPGGDPSQSPDFYAELVLSRPIMQALVDSSFGTVAGGARRPLVELLEAQGATPAQRREDAVRILRSRTSTGKNTKTGVIRVAVTSRSPTLSVDILSRLLDHVNAFNLRTRRSKATDEARFAEQRVQELSAQLRHAEEEVRAFNQRNRGGSSASLILEEARLNRAVAMRQEIYTSMAQMYEQVRLDAMRTTPALTVVEPPEPPARPDPRKAALKSALAFLFGSGFMLLIVFAREVVKHGAASENDDVARFQMLRREAVKDIRNPFRVVGAVFRRRGASPAA